MLGGLGAQPPASGCIGGLGAESLALDDFYEFKKKLRSFKHIWT